MESKEDRVQPDPFSGPTISEKPARAQAALAALKSGEHAAGEAGRMPPGGARAARPPRSVLPTPRSIFIRESEWRSGSGLRIPSAEMTALLRRLRARDVCLLQMLAQHHYLTTDHIASLFLPGATLRAARIRLRWLTEERHLLMRWRQLEPASHGWRRRPSLYLLSQCGAVVLARCLGVDHRPLIKRSWQAAEYGLQLGHDLEVIDFFVSLASASRGLPGQGLYHWVGQDNLRHAYQEEGADIAPDGWGRYLAPDREVTFTLEWDRGTESPAHLTAKGRAYATYFSRRASGHPHPGVPAKPASWVGSHVLFVAPGRVREQTIRVALARASSQSLATPVAFWTTSADLIREHGVLGPIWQPMRDSNRVRLHDLGGRPRSELAAEGCLGKPGWWDHRPGAGEGA